MFTPFLNERISTAPSAAYVSLKVLSNQMYFL
jgi:hypothetical protein